MFFKKFLLLFKWIKSLRYNLFCLALPTCVMCACTTVVPEVSEERYFWPPIPEYAKIEYVDFFETEEDLRQEPTGLVEEFLGKELPRRVFQYPYGVAVTQDGRRLYISDTKQHTVTIFDFATAKAEPLKNSDGKPALIPLPLGVAVRPDGKVFVADSKGHEIYLFSAEGQYETRFGKESLLRPTGLAYCERTQRLFVVDTGEHKIVAFDKNLKEAGTIGGRSHAPGGFNFPLDAAVAPNGDLFVLDTLNARVQVFSSQGEFLRMFGERGTAPGAFALPKSITVSEQGHVYVTDSLSHKIVIFDLEGRFLLSVGGLNRRDEAGVVAGGFYSPIGVTVDEAGAIFVVDALNRAVHRFQYLTDEYLAAHPIQSGQVAPIPRRGAVGTR
ncbi:MAG: 6-bladed beta-propeller [Desulfuromonadales bacterium]|nr:6-bladed beta-propeller [Desulfuromonadales bacterium]